MWTNPRWGSLVGPDADVLRAVFQSLQDWTRNPTFGNATNPTISGAGVQVQPGALKVFNEWIQSESFVAGSTGWQIKANGDAEFNSITIRGVFKTAASGRRVEIGTSGDATSVKWFSGDGSETSVARIQTEFAGGIEVFKILGSGFGGATPAYITLRNQFITATGQLTISQSGMPNTTSTQRGLHVSGGAGGWAMSVTGRVDFFSGSNLHLGTNTLFIGDAGLGWDGFIVGKGRIICRNDGQAWNAAPLLAESSGNVDVAIGWHQPGVAAFSFWWGNDQLGRIQRDNGTFSGVYVTVLVPSDPNLKEDVVEMESGALLKMKQIKPISYRQKVRSVGRQMIESESPVELGVMATDVAAAFPEAATYDQDGNPAGYRLSSVVAATIKAIQELDVRLESLEKVK